jgi:hypothetical protein
MSDGRSAGDGAPDSAWSCWLRTAERAALAARRCGPGAGATARPCVRPEQAGARRAAHRLLRSTSAFLQAMFEKRRPTPLMEVRANMTLTLPSRLVLSTRRMCWKLDSFMISEPMADLF